MDENSKIGDGGAPKADDSHPNSDLTTNSETNPQASETETDVAAAVSRQSSRTPFTNLSQVDADLALARTLQEQVSLSHSGFVFSVLCFTVELARY